MRNGYLVRVLLGSTLMVSGPAMVSAQYNQCPPAPPPPPPVDWLPPGTPPPLGETFRVPTGATPTRPQAGPPPGRTGAGEGAARTGRRGGARAFTKRRAGTVEDHWQFWWEFNLSRFLTYSTREGYQAPSQSGRGLVGRMSPAAPADRRLSRTDVSQQVVPALLAALQDKDAAVVQSASIALGRSVRQREREALLALRRTLAHEDAAVRETAALSLGLLGSPEAEKLLVDLARDNLAGRQARGRAEGVEFAVRANAVAGLGLTQSAKALDTCLDLLSHPTSVMGRELQALAVLSLGQLPGQARRTVAFLLPKLDEVDLHAAVRAQIPIALGNLANASAAKSALPALISALQGGELEDEVNRSLVTAVGRLGDLSDGVTFDALEKAATSHSDRVTRCFALMALAEGGAGDGSPSSHAAIHQRLEALLREQLARGKGDEIRSYAALALGVYGHSSFQDDGLRGRLGSELRNTFQRARNPSHQAALAVALGLLGDSEATELLSKQHHKARNPQLEAYLALSLGMLQAREHEATFIERMNRKGLDPFVRVQYARAIGVMGSHAGVTALVQLMTAAGSREQVQAAAYGLGLVGSRKVMDPLLKLLADGKSPDFARDFAATALGMLAEDSELAWNTAFREHSNYLAASPVLARIQLLL